VAAAAVAVEDAEAVVPAEVAAVAEPAEELAAVVVQGPGLPVGAASGKERARAEWAACGPAGDRAGSVYARAATRQPLIRQVFRASTRTARTVENEWSESRPAQTCGGTVWEQNVKEDDIYRMIDNRQPQGEQGVDPGERNVSPEVKKRALDPLFMGEISAPDGYAHVRGDCGDTMEVFLAVRNRRICQARFDTIGCGFTLACGSIAMEMAEGKPVTQALRIDEHKIEEALGGLPDSHRHCAELASEALKKAIQDHLFHGKESWKKTYRNR
jgi:nitrogen fixation NifU-like protein